MRSGRTFYSVDFVIMGLGSSIAWFDEKQEAVWFHSSVEYSDMPIAHKFCKPSTIDEHLLLVAQTKEMKWVKYAVINEGGN